MANYYGSARTNFVKVENLDALIKSLAPFDIKIEHHSSDPSYVALFPITEDGCFPSIITIYSEDDDIDDEEVEFSFEEHVMPFIAEGEVLVAQSTGSEKQRYVSAWAGSYIRQGEEVKSVELTLDDIYEKASQAFGVPTDHIAHNSYDSLSAPAMKAISASKVKPKA